GVYRLEILADGPFGTEVLANFPVFAAVDEPPISLLAPPPGVALPADETVVSARLFALLNEARKAANVPPLKEHAGLAEVARSHSSDMVGSGFFGHVSPVNGDPETRVHRKGLAFVSIAENVGRGETAEEVDATLLDSPGH